MGIDGTELSQSLGYRYKKFK